MQSLYSNGFELVYDNMYQSFIDYEDEFHFYNNILQKYHKKKVLEIGSGTGNLARHFIKHHINYKGLDYSQDMINLASKKNPKGEFIHANMTGFNLNNPVDSIIITGRTTSYLLSNQEVHDALKSFSNNLEQDGLLCFDFIDANRFFKVIQGGKTFKHATKFNQQKYYRESTLNTNTSNNFMFDWSSKYYKVSDNKNTLIAEDNSEVRAFTKNEWELLLYLNNFEVLEIIDKPSYMFDCFAIVAQKKL